MDEARRLEIKAWLTKARQDMQSAEWLMESPDHLYNAVGFHCQQAAEKTLKAYLTWQDEPFEKTHSLVALIGKCLSFEPTFESLRLAASTLTPYAVIFRYPGDLPELSTEEANQAINHARQIFEFGMKILPAETFPDE